MNINDKLQSFSQVVLAEAEDRRQRLQQEMEEQVQAACENAQSIAQKKMNTILQEEEFKAEQMCNREVLRASQSAKRSLIDLRTQLTDTLFENVENMLRDYQKTNAYQAALVSDITQLANSYPEGIVVTVSKNDYDYLQTISPISGVSYVFCEEQALGGFSASVNGRNTIYNQFYESKLKEARRTFQGFSI